MPTDYSGTMYGNVEGKPCPFCGCEEIRSYTYHHSGGWTTNVECSQCLAQIPCDKVEDALEQWNTRVDPQDIRRIRAHMKQVEWERDQAVLKLEKAQLIIDLNIGGEMKQEVAEAIAILKAQGVEVAVDPSGAQADVYIATVPNGDKYDFLAAGILKLKAEGKLTVAGLAESSMKR
jgi:Lar family restriction alleviation protein